MRPFSSILLDGPERAAARAMLYPVGFKEEDFAKPIIGIASTWSNVTPSRVAGCTLINSRASSLEFTR